MPQRCRSLIVAALFMCLLMCLSRLAVAAPIEPSSDSQVIEVLPGQAAERARQRRERLALNAQPANAALAFDMATRLLAQARDLGDSRFAGQAMAVLAPWTDDATMPPNLLLMKATLQQYVHEFDTAAITLGRLLARTPADAQAWLTLATIRRVQGRYAESDTACNSLLQIHAALHAKACLAENAALRGDFDAARSQLDALIASPGLTDSLRAWLLTTKAELEERSGDARASEAAYREVLKLGPDSYAALGFADLLIDQRRPREALAVLRHEVRSDVVLLRVAIAGMQARSSTAAADAAELRERFAAENLRPDAQVLHGREQAMFALHVEGDKRRAFELAKVNVVRQREPLDVLVLARAASALGEQAALAEARRVRDEMGLHDRRIDALL